MTICLEEKREGEKGKGEGEDKVFMKSRKTERTKEKYEGEENRREDMRGRECVRKELREMRKKLGYC